jgi:hypothetical protein
MARGEEKTPEERLHRQNCRFYVACPKCGADAGEKCTGTKGQRRFANHVERWRLFDPAHIAARSVSAKKERPVTERRPLHLAREDITCKSCGAECYWQEVVTKDGHIKPRLFENGKPHVCRPSADDFDVVGG